MTLRSQFEYRLRRSDDWASDWRTGWTDDKGVAHVDTTGATILEVRFYDSRPDAEQLERAKANIKPFPAWAGKVMTTPDGETGEKK
jgi:hypothetical protein